MKFVKYVKLIVNLTVVDQFQRQCQVCEFGRPRLIFMPQGPAACIGIIEGRHVICKMNEEMNEDVDIVDIKSMPRYA